MEITNWISLILNILAFLGIITSLWMAGRLLPSFITWINTGDRDDLFSNPWVKIILWLAVGSLFALPLLDIVGFLGNLVDVVFVPQREGTYSTLLGTVSTQVYISFYIFLKLAVYGIILYLAIDYLLTPGRFNRSERIFIVLSVASLVYRGINAFFAQVINLQIPTIIYVQQNYGIYGYLFEVLIGIVIFATILIGLNRVLPNHPASGK